MFKYYFKLNPSYYWKDHILMKYTRNAYLRQTKLSYTCVHRNSSPVYLLAGCSRFRPYSRATNNLRTMPPIANEFSSKDEEYYKKLFPQPANILDNVSVQVKNHTGKPMFENTEFKQTGHWTCTRTINWPELKTFVGAGSNKQKALNICCLEILIYLHKANKINNKNQAVFYDKKEIERLLSEKIFDISTSEELAEENGSYVENFHEITVPLMSKKEKQEREEKVVEVNKNINTREEVSYSQKIRRNKILKDRATYIMTNERQKKFPIYSHKEKLLQLLENNKVVVIKGEPGCGKSTQVPQYILENASLNDSGIDCNILVTQPRRISATSLAQAIANEREEKIGDVIGYHVRFDSKIPNSIGGSITFCSTGIALKKITTDPALKEYSHIIVDEAHERDLDIDTLLLLLKTALEKNPCLKVIVMSATMDAKLFHDYYNDSEILEIPGFTYPVQAQFLDEIKTFLNLKKYLRDSHNPVVYEDEIATMIEWIHKNKPPGAILSFLPGWQEIKKVQLELEKKDISDTQILKAHSKLSLDTQRKIFHIPPNNIRKVVLSTNICETSITINDISYVIDSGVHKDKHISETGLESLQTRWISQASVNQRKGRAGRVKSGESYHLFTRAKYHNLPEYRIPEILRTPLEKLVLDSKIYDPLQPAKVFLAKLIEPPPVKTIDRALDELTGISALDDQEKLTDLGHKIVQLPMSPKLGKALVYGVIFKCFDPILTICSIYSAETEIAETGEASRGIKSKYDKNSDHLAMAKLYKDWKNGMLPSNIAVEDRMMQQIKKVKNQQATIMRDLGMLSKYENYENERSECNEFAHDDELVKAVLYSAVNSVCEHKIYKIVQGVLRKAPHFTNSSGQKLQLTTHSILHDRVTFPSPFLCYISEVHSVERRRSLVSEASVLSPMALLLFTESEVRRFEQQDDDKSKSVIQILENGYKLKCNADQLDYLLDLRIILWDVVRYFISNMGKPDIDLELWDQMCQQKDYLLLLITKLLKQQKQE